MATPGAQLAAMQQIQFVVVENGDLVGRWYSPDWLRGTRSAKTAALFKPTGHVCIKGRTIRMKDPILGEDIETVVYDQALIYREIDRATGQPVPIPEGKEHLVPQPAPGFGGGVAGLAPMSAPRVAPNNDANFADVSPSELGAIAATTPTLAGAVAEEIVVSDPLQEVAGAFGLSIEQVRERLTAGGEGKAIGDDQVTETVVPTTPSEDAVRLEEPPAEGSSEPLSATESGAAPESQGDSGTTSPADKSQQGGADGGTPPTPSE